MQVTGGLQLPVTIRWGTYRPLKNGVVISMWWPGAAIFVYVRRTGPGGLKVLPDGGVVRVLQPPENSLLMKKLQTLSTTI